jgi:hypothetical protein
MRSTKAHGVAFVAAAILLCGSTASAVQFTLASHVGDLWTYTLTYDPLDNYNQPSTIVFPTTITLSGLFGVTSAGGPTSTDFLPVGGLLDTVNQHWTPTVLNGGTTVVWANEDDDAGTGNFGDPKHVLCFTIVSDGIPGDVSLDTNGFATDTTNFDRDIIGGNTFGPVAVPEPATLGLVAAGCAALAARRRTRAHTNAA